jgi:Fe-S cluster biogenesis protein NfuA
MDVHGAGLERIMEIVFESGGTGPAIIDELGHDSITGCLLLLYSLHPDDLETRVNTAMERMRPRLRKVSYSVDLIRVNEGAVEIRVTSTSGGHSCGSTARDVRAIVEEGIYELAPDVTSLEIRGLEEPANTGFVAIESLIGHSLVAATHNVPALRTEGD